MKDYYRISESRIGSSFDWQTEDESAILEIKTVDYVNFKKDWHLFQDNTFLAPEHIELQVQHQLAVSGRQTAYIGVLVGGNTAYFDKRERNEDVIAEIFLRVAQFWANVDAGNAPSPDFERDSAAVAALYSHAEPGTVIEPPEGVTELVEHYLELGDSRRELEKKQAEIKGRILMAIGDAEKVVGDGFTISANVVAPGPVSYERKGYRQFKVYKKKGRG
jgi:predicted phage-related endonuclease